MINIRNGSYALYENFIFELNTMTNDCCELISRNDIKNKYKKLGFIQYNENVCYLLVKKKNIKSAYYVYTFCTYKGYKFQISESIIENKKIRIWHSLQAQMYFKDYAHHGYDPYLDVDKCEIDEIWEERTPIEGFVFDVEPIYYIYKKSK